MTSGGNPTFGTEQSSRHRGRLRPVAHKARWITGGLALQLVGVGSPTVYVYTKAKHLGLGDALTFATVKLAWHNSLHTKAGAVTLAAGLAVFAIGSVLLARPFTKHVVTLAVAVPLAAVGGALVLGVVAMIAALFVFLLDSGYTDSGYSGGSSRRLDDMPMPTGGPGDEPTDRSARKRPRVIELQPVGEATEPADGRPGQPQP